MAVNVDIFSHAGEQIRHFVIFVFSFLSLFFFFFLYGFTPQTLPITTKCFDLCLLTTCKKKKTMKERRLQQLNISTTKKKLGKIG